MDEKREQTGRDYERLLREFFRIYPDYPLCKSLVQNLRDGVCSLDHAEQLIYNKASGSAQNREAIDEKLDQRKIEIDGQWRLLKDLPIEQIRELSEDGFRQAAGFYLKNPYTHHRTARPAWYRLPATRNAFLRALCLEASSRGMQDLAEDLRALLHLA